MAFELDTSGEVFWPGPEGHSLGWSDLSPFAQGYVEALFADKRCEDCPPTDYPTDRTRCAPCLRKKGFSDLHPDTLAAILRDCEAPAGLYVNTVECGEAFWRDRQAGVFQRFNDQTRFPPLTPYLDDTGRVCLRETA
jgi:hypothetical protein